jgi:hypothetical protein
MTSTRLRGKALTLKIGSTEVVGDFNSVVLQSEDAADDVSVFGSTASDFFIQATGIQSTDDDSFQMFCWDNAETEVVFYFRPQGGTSTTASAADAPVWTGTLIIPARGRLAIGGEANPRGTWTWEARFDIIGEPTILAVP